MDKKDDTWQELHMDAPKDAPKDTPEAFAEQKGTGEDPLRMREQKAQQYKEENFTFDADTMSETAYHTGSITKIDNERITVTLLQELVALLRPKPFRKRHPILFWGGILLVGFLAWGAIFDEEGSWGGERIAVVRVENAIMDAEPTLKWIAELEKMDHVKGILLRIDSPGGSAGASQEIHGALMHLAKKKPIVASMGSAAASGGLMVAMAAQYIVANPSTITGSIGVRMDIPQIYKLLDSFGVTQESITSGKYKDAGSMMRELSPEDREYLQGLVNDLKGQFIAMVAEGRKKPVEEIEKIADGRVFTGQEALSLGLVDALGGQFLALAHLQELTGVPVSTELLENEKFSDMYGPFMESMAGLVQALSGAKQAQMEFLY